MRYTVVESKAWKHNETGQTVSPYGACPWNSPAEKSQWTLVTRGWTLYDKNRGTVGVGRQPCKTLEEAQELAETFNNPLQGYYEKPPAK